MLCIKLERQKLVASASMFETFGIKYCNDKINFFNVGKQLACLGFLVKDFFVFMGIYTYVEAHC